MFTIEFLQNLLLSFLTIDNKNRQAKEDETNEGTNKRKMPLKKN